MKKTQQLAIVVLALSFSACLANDGDLAEEESGMSEQELKSRERPREILDCSKQENETCWECGYQGDDIQYCCFDPDCDVINEPPQPEPQPTNGGRISDYTFDTSLTLYAW